MYLILLASCASAGDSLRTEALMKRAPVAKSMAEPKSINSFLPPDQAFLISTNCKGVDEAFCSGAKYLDLIRTAVKSASMLLAKEILIRKPINVHVFFAAEMPVEAMGTRNLQPFPAKKLNEDRALNYPAALIKQCSLKNEVKYSYSADVYLVFHTKRYWNLVPGTEKIAEGQNDMEAHALRALIQGMGFQSELYLSKLTIDGKRIVVPGLQNLDGRAQHISLFTLSAFDNLLSGSTTFASHGKVLAGANRQPTMVMQQMPSVLINNKQVAASMIELYRMIESESLRIRFPNNDSVLMYHFRFDVEYTPIRYFGNVLASGPDFLMSPFFRPGTSLISEMKKLKVDSPIGPYTIRVMEALGYATKANPQILELELVI